MKMIKSWFSNFKKELLIVIFLLVISSIVVLPLFRYGLPPTHDGEYHVIRAYQFDKTLREGSFYPRWLPDLNYGYGTPLLNYYYPLPYYATSFFHFLGASFIDSFKLSMVIATLIGTVFFFLWARMFWGNGGGFISSLLYIFAPYHIVELYIRGTVGEVWALAFFPAFLWSVTKVIKERKILFVPISAIFFSLIIFSHNILALMFSPFALSYMVFMIMLSKQKLYPMCYTLYALFLGLGLSAIFWLPALAERSYVTGLQIYNIKENFPEIYQLLFPSWGTGFSGSDVNGQMSFQIGLANLGVVFLSIALLFVFYKKKDKRFGVIGFFLSWFVITTFLLQRSSLFIWENLPLMNYFQFPWRFLALEILIASFLGGCLVSLFKGKKSIVVIGLISIISIGLSIGYINPAYYLERDDAYYITRPNFIDGTNTPGNFFNTIWFDKNIIQRKQKKIEIINGGKGMLTNINIYATKYNFDIVSDSGVEIRVNTAYFPGWEIAIDGVRKDSKKTKEGLIEFFVPQGTHNVKVQFNNTPIRILGNIISSLSVLGLLLFLIRKRNDII